MAKRYNIEARAAREGLTAETLRDLLSYDPETGIFRWLKPRSNALKVGQIAGALPGINGYKSIYVLGRARYQHRLAWLYVHGAWPKGHIDHADGDRANNRISNLRECDDSNNLANSRKGAANTSGYKGVVAWTDGRWRAQIGYKYKCYHLGIFDTKEAAHAAYVAEAQRLFGEFSNAGGF